MKDTQAQMAAVQVAIRIRPLTEKDRAQPRFANSANGDVLKAQEKHIQVVSQNKYFTYDHVFSTETQQTDIFQRLGQKPVQKFVEGYNVTMLAYGQTSSGKTYTMGTALHTDAIDPEEEGIVPRAMALLFDILHQQQQQQQEPTINPGRSLRPISRQPQQKSNYRFSVKVSFVEIYNEELIDLLNSAHPSEKPPVTIREDTKGHIYWTGVKEVTVHNTDDVLFYLQQGTENRATGSTDMNEKSSRSHAIFSVTLKQEKFVPSSPQSSRAASPVASRLKQHPRKSAAAAASNSSAEDGDWLITSSKFHFVDLAGSERLKRTAAEGDRRKEGININAGLLALGNVISALGDPSKKSTHVPYRDSKLTRLLQDSLGGSAMTLMIACVSPAESNLSETLNTLQYANRARNIKNKMEKNEMEEWMTTDNLELLRSTISKLKNELRTSKNTTAAIATSSIPTPPSTNNHRLLSDFSDEVSSASSPVGNPDFDDLYHEQRVRIADLQQQVEELEGTAEFIKERNVMVEKELMRLRQEPPSADSIDFQHLVEPVIEEYEKSISGLESQLAMIRAALSHSDQGFEEQQAKIEQCEIVIESQEKTILELRRRVGKLLERRQEDETYVTGLEKKLMTAVEQTVHDRGMLSDLRGKILKFKEVDENTEQYIHDLEARLTASEAERTELKEKLNQLVNTTKEETLENTEEKIITDQDHQRELEMLREKHDVVEKERQQLQIQVDQFLAASASNELKESAADAIQQTIHDENAYKDLRILDLESKLSSLQHEHQETMKELDEVLLRYQEALETTEAEQQPVHSKTNSDEEMQLLRQSIQHLEHELDMASRRESIFRQMSEEHQESAEVEKTLQKLEVSQSEDPICDELSKQQQALDNEFILYSLDVLQTKYQQLLSELELRNINIPEDDSNVLYQHHESSSMTDIHTQYEAQLLCYKRELKNVTRLMKVIKRVKVHESKTSTTNPEHKMLIKSVVGLDKQLTEQYDKMKLEAKRFSKDVLEMISLNGGLENELGVLKKSKESQPDHLSDNQQISSKPSSPHIRHSMIRPPTQFSNGSNSSRASIVNLSTHDDHENPGNNNQPDLPSPSSTDLVLQYEKNCHALQTRLVIAKQDLKAHQTVICALENKLKTSEIALNTCRKRMEGSVMSVTDIEIEELMSKMDAMKIQLETNENKEINAAVDIQS